MKKKTSRVANVLSSLLLASLLMTSCGGAAKATPTPAAVKPSAQSSAAPAASAPAKETPKPASNLTKVTVEVWDRNNAPAGLGSAIDNRWTKMIVEGAKSVGLDIEYIACPREQEKEKLNTWMATGTAPDIIMTYDFNLVKSFAEKGGIWELDSYLASDGKALTAQLGDLFPFCKINGKTYAVAGLRGQTVTDGNLKIRGDWLKAGNLPMPKNVEELYKTLVAFKTADPGKVGKDKVVPFAISAPGTAGTPGNFRTLMRIYGIRNDAGEVFPTVQSGNYDKVTSTYKSPVDMPQAKSCYQFLSKLYKEGLIHKEFAVDTTGEKFNQHVSSGIAGFVDVNKIAINELTKTAVPTVDWTILDVIPCVDGSPQIIQEIPRVRWYNIVPKTSKNPGAAVKFMNWYLESGMCEKLNNGIEGEHYKKDTNGLRIPIANVDTKDRFAAGDINFLGSVGSDIPLDKFMLTYTGDAAPYNKKAYENYMGMKKEPGIVLNGAETKVRNEKGPQLQKYFNEGVAKVIVAEDFEKEYTKFVDGWYKLGGKEFDEELAVAIKTVMANMK